MERWTLDERKDFHLIKKIIETLSKIKEDFKMLDILNILNANPDWRELNGCSGNSPAGKGYNFKGAGSEQTTPI